MRALFGVGKPRVLKGAGGSVLALVLLLSVRVYRAVQ